MTDYFNDYPSIVSNKNLSSSADTPYETSSFIRSKRSSRATPEPLHDDANSSGQLAPRSAEHQENGRFSGIDPRRFTPTLHASLVSEILNLRRELDSKNHLVENLETNLSGAKSENETLTRQLSENAREVRKAKQQVQQMEKGTYEALEDLVQERDVARSTADELRTKLENLQKKTRGQDEDAVRTQSIWEDEKQRWDNERRQLERRIHVTETRLRTFVDQMAAHQASADPRAAHAVDFADDGTFKDSGLGNESDTASIRTSTPAMHRRNKSSVSIHPANIRSSISSRATMISPDLYAKPMGNSLADELGIDEEDESDVDEFENDDEELEYPERVKRSESRQSEFNGEADSKAKRILGLTTHLPDSPNARDAPRKQVVTSPTIAEEQQLPLASPTAPPSDVHKAHVIPRVVYVDNGYQPSPPPSPKLPAKKDTIAEDVLQAFPDEAVDLSAARESTPLPDPTPVTIGELTQSPISPPQTPVVGGAVWSPPEGPPAIPPIYATASTQTEVVEPVQTITLAPARDTLSPLFVPSIAIHPPSSRPSTPRASVLPPGTRNASTQAVLPWPCRDASVQTEEIRVDRRPVKLPPHLLPSHLLPSPSLPEPRRATRGSLGPALTEIVTKLPLEDEPRSPPPTQPLVESSPEQAYRDGNWKDNRSLPLKAIPLPRPVLSPIISPQETTVGNGPLNRSSQYGVVQPRRDNTFLTDRHDSSDGSDVDILVPDIDPKILNAVTSTTGRAPQGRFGLSEPPKAVPENKEVSPDRRPRTADSYVGAPAPSVASARTISRAQNYSRPSQKRHPSRDLRSRSPSLGSLASSNNSTGLLAQYPPYPIPTRSSSRALSKTHSEGSHSPSRENKRRSGRSSKSDLRKVRSAAAMRNKSGRSSPSKPVRRRRRSPDLTPVVSMAFDDSPAPTKFPIPELPTPLQHPAAKHSVNNSVDTGHPSTTSSVLQQQSEEDSYVNAIAATMVGEWLWKYTRKRKSFGLGEDSSKFPIGPDGVVDVTGHGIRHKRWVWLSPTEQTIMWDTKQPTTSTALLGKKGRKLNIQSVLEVKDLTPLPKDAELKSAFNRSILILTPARALKFTAITQDRHDLWMTALSLLVHSGPSVPSAQIPYPVPSLPSVESVPIKRHRSPSFARGTVRDSIRLAKGKRPIIPFTSSSRDRLPTADPDGADAPSVPRLYISTIRHQRKRSNTSPRGAAPLATTLRSLSSSVIPPPSSSASSAMHQHQHHRHISSSDFSSSFRPPFAGSANASPALPATGFFDAGSSTMRMEAFVDPNVRDGVLYVPAPPPPTNGQGSGVGAGAPTVRLHHGNSRDLHHLHYHQGQRSEGVGKGERGGERGEAGGAGGTGLLSQATIDRRRAGYVFDEDALDPFKGF